VKYHDVTNTRVMENDRGELFLMVVINRRKEPNVLYVPLQTMSRIAKRLRQSAHKTHQGGL